MEPLYKEELDNLECTCGQPACEERIVFHSNCHIFTPTWVEYSDGVITINCGKQWCNKEIIRIAVARRQT